MQDQAFQRLIVPEADDAPTDRVPTTIVIGDIARWQAQGRSIPPMDGTKFVNPDELSKDVIDATAPDIILSPLIADEFDVVDIAAKLASAEFRGRYRAIADDLPDADLIREEIRQFAPHLDFDILLMTVVESSDAVSEGS